MDEASGQVINCGSQSNEECVPIVLTWKTERYCGIYKKAPNSLSEEKLRVGSSPTTVDEWEAHEGHTVLLADDEHFEMVIGEAADIGSDLLCGQFAPPVNLVDVKSGDKLNLEIYCKPVVAGIRLMPASSAGYPLTVQIVKDEKSWFGCSK